MISEPEFITIVEGPTPEFRTAIEPWLYSLVEMKEPFMIAVCEVRSLNGKVLRERCQRTWREGRPMRLDFRKMNGLRQQLEIVTVRLEELPEGDLLHIWVRHKPGELEMRGAEGDRED